ncbi:HD family phosphohydrolase [Oceanidesulfovibrio marinus]|uniref:Cyclic nucleotide-binding protein n=1 Tax=Oceanidesulfovibrio marinus TaxID=370038 RepID=A0A6P1ZHI2_9BACT|nr:HDIG domain-containing metalloprotein [Oceanidesulfovibrio marinus]QJT08567.1 HDIG domain-containing protein [Oceanidesulfovibrio marinus]TVM32599.1 cyclic nucleotide-binding protein [Oceanidesulfovibrio marinus]
MSNAKKTEKKSSKAKTQPMTPRLKPREDVSFLDRRRAGTIGFLIVLSALALMGGVRINPGVKIFAAGEIADQDVTAMQDLLVEERQSTLEKIQHISESQPPVFNLSLDSAQRTESRLSEIYGVIHESTPDTLEEARWQVSEILNREISLRSIEVLRNNEMENLAFIRVLPWLEERLAQGVVFDDRLLDSFKNGIIVQDKAAQQDTLRLDLSQIDDVDTLGRDLERFLHIRLDLSLRQRKALLELFRPLITPTLAMDPEASQERVSEVISSVEPVYYHIKKGEVIVRKGERVTPATQLKLQALFSQVPQHFEYLRPMGIFLLGILFAVFLALTPRGSIVNLPTNRDALLVSFILLLVGAGAKLIGVIEVPLADRITFLSESAMPLLLPVAGAAGVIALFFSMTTCILVSTLFSFVSCQLLGEGLGMFAYYFLGAVLYSVVIKRAQTRTDVLKSVLPLLAGLFLAWAGMRLLDTRLFSDLATELTFVAMSGFISLILTTSFSPVAETVFGYTSRFRLMEQMSLEQPLLQELMVVAPGTYHHSLIVANMVEAGARAIGANALLCKVAALYHDIGKLKNPDYFIENQMGTRNRHDKLAPSMSALILIAHVKKGVELAKQNKLSTEIVEIIRQHHGTALISYFYNKAMEQADSKGADPVQQEDYRYPGPKPQTREAGIVMLADVVEASSRALLDPTPSRIKNHVTTIMRAIFNDGQLDQSELTLKDLNQLSETFSRILTGIFHQRIEYPGQNKSESRNGAEQRNGAGKNGLDKATSTGLAVVPRRYGSHT